MIVGPRINGWSWSSPRVICLQRRTSPTPNTSVISTRICRSAWMTPTIHFEEYDQGRYPSPVCDSWGAFALLPRWRPCSSSSRRRRWRLCCRRSLRAPFSRLQLLPRRSTRSLARVLLYEIFCLIRLEITNVCTLSHSIIARHYCARCREAVGFISFSSSSSFSYFLEQRTGVSGLKSNGFCSHSAFGQLLFQSWDHSAESSHSKGLFS